MQAGLWSPEASSNIADGRRRVKLESLRPSEKCSGGREQFLCQSCLGDGGFEVAEGDLEDALTP